ncbi:hypothetical protein HDU87_008327 [Geranomyces variabilis]|uniref:ARID domain-containing protein n=1 Tax=Geranomyces variabilis TaxID=109894 RepID=A0AAD5XJU6_9FUNG|nr:hypothetical protein HDU87_008327 [Geranomyces variabilis]
MDQTDHTTTTTTTTTATAMSSAQFEPVSGSESGGATPDVAAPRAAPSGAEGDKDPVRNDDEREQSTSIPPPPLTTADDRPAASPAVTMMDVDAENTSIAETSMENGGGVAGEDDDESGVGDVAAAGTHVALKDDPMDEDLPIGGGGESRGSSMPPSGDTASLPQRQFHPIDVSRDTFAAVYGNFLKLFHFQNPAARHCRLAEHLAKFDTPPKNQKRTFDTYDFFEVVKEIGGVEKIKSWSEVARRLGFDPRGTNIAARVKDWMVYHHIGAYFDFLLGISNEFFAQARGELDESDILSAITGAGKRQDQEGSVQDDQSQQGVQLLPAKRRAKKSLEPLPSSRRRTGTVGSAASSVQGDSGSARWRPTGTGSDLEDYGTPNSSRERGARGSGSGTGGRSKTKLSSSRKSRKRSRSGSLSSAGTASSRSRSSSRSGGNRGRRAMAEQHSYRGEHPLQHQQQPMHPQQQHSRGGDPALDHNMRQRGPPIYGQNGGVLPSPDYHLPPPHQQQQHPGAHQRSMNEGYNHPHSHHHPHHHPHHHHPSPQPHPAGDASQQQQHPLHYRGYPSYPLEHPAAPYASPVDHARMLPSSGGGGNTPYNANNNNNHHQYHQPQPLALRQWAAGGYTPTGGSTPASGVGGDILRRATPTTPAPAALQLPPSAASSVRGVSPSGAAAAAAAAGGITVKTHPDDQQAGGGGGGGGGGNSTPSGMASSSSALQLSPALPPAAPPSSQRSSRPASRAASPYPLVMLSAPPAAASTTHDAAGEPTTTTTTTTAAAAAAAAADPAIATTTTHNPPPSSGGGGGGGDHSANATNANANANANEHPLTTHLSHLTHLLSTQPSVHHLQRDNADLRARCFAAEERAARADARCMELAELLRSSNEMVRVMREELGDARVGLDRAARVREVVRGLLEDLPGGGGGGNGGGDIGGGPGVHAPHPAAVAPGGPVGTTASRGGHAAGMHLGPR